VLNGRSEPVAIRHIEQFLIERALSHGLVEAATPPPLGKSVAVLGSDPGGLACADELAGLGYSVTVHDSTNAAGGLLFASMPEFKLEKAVLERRTALMQKRGVTFQLGRSLGSDLSLEKLLSQFDAVYLALNGRAPRALAVPGSTLPGVNQALGFLVGQCAAAPPGSVSPQRSLEGKRVVVLGGGDTAIDCARTAARRGACETTVVYRREQEDMPCTPHEYENAAEEGIRFVFCAEPVEFVANSQGRLATLRCCRTRMLPAQSGQRRGIVSLPGGDLDLPADLAILALGFDPIPISMMPLVARLAANSSGTAIAVDSSQQTSIPGVFAGGDLTSGPSLILHAVRDGRRAARGIHSFLSGQFKRQVDSAVLSR
jgi:glutamate synthase (NADPH/NADH) small chain